VVSTRRSMYRSWRIGFKIDLKSLTDQYRFTLLILSTSAYVFT
jgi:hypothetical protein